LKSYHDDLGWDSKALTNVRVERIIQGANRFHGIKKKDQPVPITLPLLRRLVAYIRSQPSTFGGPLNALGLVACFTLSFACFLRMGETTYTTFDSRFDLSWANLSLAGTGIDENTTITIPASKTDPFRKGVTVIVPKGPRDICPVTALREYKAQRRPVNDTEPLFTNGLTKPFNRSQVSRYLAQALSGCGHRSSLFSGHSFRRGAATWAASIGMSANEIKTLGRWNSDCFQLYVDAGPLSIQKAGGTLLSTPTAMSSLPPSGIPQPGQIWRPSLV
jgi:integrase